MLREVLRHIEAITKSSWEYPPLAVADEQAKFVNMIEDATVAYCLGLISDAILAEQWHIEPIPNSRGSSAMALEIQANLNDIDLEGHLNDALNALWRGFFPHEIRWSYQNRAFRLTALAAINTEQVALELDDQMRVTAIISRISTEAQRVDAQKLWFHTHHGNRTKPAGESILQPAFRAWSTKNRLLQFWGQSIQRFGSPQWMLQIPANTPPERQTQILNTFYAARLDGVYLVPDDVTATVISPGVQPNIAFETALDYQDAQIRSEERRVGKECRL